MATLPALYLNGRLLTDDFYNGHPFDLGLDPYAPEIYTGQLLMKILPLRKDARFIYCPKIRPTRPTTEGTAEIHGLEVILQARELRLS